MLIRTCGYLLVRIAKREQNLVRLKELNAPEAIVSLEECILRSLTAQYVAKLKFLQKCMGISIN